MFGDRGTLNYSRFDNAPTDLERGLAAQAKMQRSVLVDLNFAEILGRSPALNDFGLKHVPGGLLGVRVCVCVCVCVSQLDWLERRTVSPSPGTEGSGRAC